MYINWDVTIGFNPNSVLPSKHGIPVPSYGNYGGPNYTAGEEGGTTPAPGSTDYFANLPVDTLDGLFYQHDLAYQNATSESDIFEADVLLLTGLAAIQPTEPEALLYDALSTLVILGKIVTEQGYLNLPPETQLVAAEALQNFETGLAETPGEGRSLHGVLHVFEARYADLLFA